MLTRNAPIFSPRANWNNPVVSEYSFKTSIIESRDGHEQREAMRQTARQATTMATLMTRDHITRLRADLTSGHGAEIACRAEWLGTQTSVAAASGNTLTFEATPDWMVEGGIIIATTATHEDLLTISATTATTATVEEAISTAYPAGTVIHKALPVRFPETFTVSASTETIWTANNRFEVIPGRQVETFDATPGETFEGRELFMRKPNWRSQPEINFMQNRDKLDVGIGRDFILPYGLAPHYMAQYLFSGLRPTEAHAIIDFFLRMRGRRNGFWSPIWSREFTPSETTIAGANTFRVDGSDFRTVYGGSPVYVAMVAVWDDGTHQANRLTAIGGTTDSDLTFTDAWINPVTEATKIYWLPYCRFNADTIEAQWLTMAACEITMAIKTIYAPEPEV